MHYVLITTLSEQFVFCMIDKWNKRVQPFKAECIYDYARGANFKLALNIEWL